MYKNLASYNNTEGVTIGTTFAYNKGVEYQLNKRIHANLDVKKVIILNFPQINYFWTFYILHALT